LRRERGQSLIEGTLVMLVFFALLLGVLDFGQVLFAHQSLVERVRSSVRRGSLHPWDGTEPIVNLVLYNQPVKPDTQQAGFLGLQPENVIVQYRMPTPERPDDETLTVQIVNFESHLFAPWLARALVSPRPVAVTAPMVPRAAAATP
jgi:hypothetical protein